MKNKKNIDLYDYYPIVVLAVQRYCLIKKALMIKCDDLNKEVEWVMKTFSHLDSEGEKTCGYLTIRTFKDIERGNIQGISFYFDLASS